MQIHSCRKPPPNQASARPEHRRDDREREAAEIFEALLTAQRRSNPDRPRLLLASLNRLGYAVEGLDAVGLRLVDIRRDVLPMPSPGRSPVYWFVKLTKALAEGDHKRESRALDELRRIGFTIDVDPRNRRGPSRDRA